MNKILITGGAGFIGSALAKELLKRGDSVVLIDDFNDRYDPRLKEARITHLFTDTDKPLLVRGDIRQADLLEKIFTDHSFDTVVHLAAWASVQPSIEKPALYADVNVTGTVNIFEAARKHGVKNIVFASSSSVYGDRGATLFNETDDVSRPISPYAATKAAGELLAATWNHLYDLPITCLRFFTVYGPWGRPEMALFKFTEDILAGRTIQMRGATTQRDFTFIEDIVQGIIKAIDKPNGFSIYNLGRGQAVTLPRFIKAIETSLETKANVEEVSLPIGDIPSSMADIEKAKKELGYEPVVSIEEGVNRFVEWYKNWYIPKGPK